MQIPSSKLAATAQHAQVTSLVFRFSLPFRDGDFSGNILCCRNHGTASIVALPGNPFHAADAKPDSARDSPGGGAVDPTCHPP